MAEIARRCEERYVNDFAPIHHAADERRRFSTYGSATDAWTRPTGHGAWRTT